MTRNTNQATGVRLAGRRAALVLSFLLVCNWATPQEARAASLPTTITDFYKKTWNSITHKTSTTGQNGAPTSEEMQKLNTFLKGGPNYWSVVAPYDLPRGLKVLNTDGTLKNTPLSQYLVWKRDQAPAFFDKRHPDLANAMQHNDQLRAQAQLIAYQKFLGTSTTSNTTSTTTPAAQMLSTPSSTTTAATAAAKSGHLSAMSVAAETLEAPAPAPVPEPASVASTLLLFGSAGVWFHRRRKAA